MAEFKRRPLNPLIPSEPEAAPEITNDVADIDRKVPPKIMRLTQHLHNLIYIRFFYEQIGQQPPVWIKGEMQRAEWALIDELQLEEGQGGLLHGAQHATRQSRP
jgi:hypothetical protein